MCVNFRETRASQTILNFTGVHGMMVNCTYAQIFDGFKICDPNFCHKNSEIYLVPHGITCCTVYEWNFQ